ncbi:unnamed protein product, partial [Diamesa hyperborea]
MCLTNLTFGDGNNKALLCSNKNFMRALVDQINSSSDELVQSEFCEIDGAIEFLVDMLSYEAPSKTMAVIENAGGILRNISSHIATKEEYRAILRRKDCFNILLQQLKSPSLTVVSNACGTLGNLSAQCVEDQKFLRDNQAIPMLRSLIYSKHKMISTGSTIALRHLLGCKSNVNHNGNLDSVARMMDLKELPTLNVRKQRALEIELDKNLAGVEIDDLSPSTKDDKTKDFSESKDETEVNRDSEKYRRNEVQDIEDDVDNEDAPTNFSQKYDDDDNEQERREYQESNLDQITNYSLRYAENQYGVEDGDDEEDEEEAAATKRKQKKPENVLNADDITQYFTEGTPHTVLSGAGSMSELSLNEKVKQMKTNIADDKAKITAKSGIVGSKLAATQSGVQTPDNIVNYCVEGTPGDFSRNDSLSDLEESSLVGGQKSDKAGSSKQLASKQTVIPPPLDLKKDKEDQSEKDNIGGTSKSVTFVNLADETPMMFSRTSSMGSLSSAEPTCIDDKSSIVSEFSRFASGIISPSELPDSPTQSVPQSPRRIPPESQKVDNNPISRTPPIPASSGTRVEEPTPLRSVFEDNFNSFNIENTPAHFSYATSLSNLSFDDEPKISTDSLSKDFRLMKHPSEDEEQKAKIAQEEPSFEQDVLNPTDTADQSDSESVNDNFLLESCINIGMNRNLTRVPPNANFNKPMSQEGSSTNPINIPFKNRTNDLCNDSISSVDSCDSKKDDLLEQCIRSGINNGVKKESSSKLAEQRHMMTSSPKKSLLPTYSKPSTSTSKILKSKEKVLEQKDEELLQECITTGILSNTRQDNHMANDFARMSININTTTTMDPESKNGLTTSVIVKENNVLNVSSKPHTVTDVGVEVVENQMKMSSTMLSKADYTYNNNCVNNYNNNSTYNSKEKIENRDRNENTVSKSDHSRQGIWTMPNGSNNTSNIRSKLNRIRTSAGSSSSPGNNDDSMEYERQNSETESQRDLKNSLVYDGNSSLEKEEAIDVTPQNEAT